MASSSTDRVMVLWRANLEAMPDTTDEPERKFLDGVRRSWGNALYDVSITASRMKMSRGSTRRMMNRMEKRGWLKRWPE